MSEHTALPWMTVTDGKLIYIDSDLDNICDLYHNTTSLNICTKMNAEANAAFIVKAVNNHDKLVDALEHANALLIIVSDKLKFKSGDSILEVISRNQALLKELK